MVEKIIDNKKILAIILRYNYFQKGIKFFTSKKFSDFPTPPFTNDRRRNG